MKSFFALLLVFVLHVFSAQENDSMYANGIFSFEENKPQKIFTDHTCVRKQPNLTSPVLDSLQTNQEVVILKKEKTVLKLGERAAPWYRISYQKNGKTSEGYIWGGNLCIGYRNKNGYDFLFGLTKTMNKKNPDFEGSFQQNYASVKVLEGNALLDEVTFETGSGESLNYAAFTVESSHKLKGVILTLKATVSGEACGIPSYTQYVVLKDKKLILLPLLMNVSDAGVYYHSEEFIFPNDKGGVPNAFILKMEEMERDDKDREKRKKSSKRYIWNGNIYFIK